MLDDFVARWVGVLEVWRAEKDLSLSKVDLQHLIEQLFSWFTGGMFLLQAPGRRGLSGEAHGYAWDLKEQKWGKYRDMVVEKLARERGLAVGIHRWVGKASTPWYLYER